jgi:hypothetical protein
MAENIPIHDETLRTIHASAKDASFPAPIPAGPKDVFPLNRFKEFCNSLSAESSGLSYGPYHRAGLLYC